MTRPAAALTRLSHQILLVDGWRRAAIAFAAGAFSVLALAPFHAWPVLFLTFPVIVWLLDGAADRAGTLGGAAVAAGIGWWFGFGYFLAGLYWIGIAFLVDAQTFGWLLPFAVTLMPAGLALFMAMGFALARVIWVRGPLRIVALAVTLTATEWLRGHILTGFPWNTFGYALTAPASLAQAAALIGVWGLTFFAIILFASPALLADEPADSPRPWRMLAGAGALLVGFALYGTVRLAQLPTEFVPEVRLRIMQPNLSQDAKFNYGAKDRVMQHYLTLSDRATGPNAAGVKDATHLIWPESAFPFFLAQQADALAQIAALLPPGTTLITGGVRSAAAPGERSNRAYNSVYVVGHDGSILSVYDKVHLVPFGEYLPFQAFLERLGLQQLTKLQGGFIPGDRRRLMTAPRAPSFLPLICYEIIFPGAAVPDGEQPAWMLNLTNDGWFGNSTGPYQHFQQARVRAIEEGVPVVRAANTGISAVVDPVGRVIASLRLGTEGVLDSRLPQRIASPLYARAGDGPLAFVAAVALVMVLRRRFAGR
jgi:apolipoprotein N-acyltransferase